MKNLLFYILWPVLAGLVFAATVLLVIEFKPEPSVPVPAVPTDTAISDQLSPEVFQFTFRDAIKRTSAAIVSINSQLEYDTGQRVFIPQDRRILAITDYDKSQGSGVIISQDGYIITSLHIFESNKENIVNTALTITLSDGRVLPAQPVAMDEYNDLILLKVDATGLPFMTLGSPRALSQGDLVLAIGNPRNLGQSVSLGIISALLSTGDSFLIQTDAAINPGNSGGALIDYQGNLIGITSTIISESGGFEGIGFATPAQKAVQLMNAFLESAPMGYLGVHSTAQGLVPLRSFNRVIGGYQVAEVVPESAAEKAGILPGDIITAINDTPVELADNGRKFKNAMSVLNPGEEVVVRLFRNGEFLTLNAILGQGVERPFLELPPPAGISPQTTTPG